jgi:UDP-N-acetylmuramoyl-L-alanyl-D-glutamate--2,6-diaminopimelate ligase
MNFAIMSNNEKIHRIIKSTDLFDGLQVRFPPGMDDFRINGIPIDSRKVRQGNLFIAVPGHSQDGRKYIAEAVSLGASAVLTAPGKKIDTSVPIITADNLRNVISIVANRFYEFPSGKLNVAGITGTNGKTTTVYLLAGIYESVGKKWGKVGTIAYETGSRVIPAQNTTPGQVDVQQLLAEMVDNKLDGCAMEVSSHALDQGRCDGVKFSSATFTNLTQDHLDYHDNMEKYFLSKAALFDNVACSVINVDDEYGRRLLSRADGRIMTFAFDQDADLRCRSISADIGSSVLEFRHNGRAIRFELPLPGYFNHLNAAAAGATALASGLSLEEVTTGLSKAASVPGRMQAISMGQPYGVYVDYAHTHGALERLLESVKNFKPQNIHLVFGCGGDRDVTKRPLMAEVASRLADYVYLTTDNPRTEDPGKILKDTLAGITDKKRCQVIEDRALAVRAAITSAASGDIVVIAGKGHEEYQIVEGVRKYFSDIEAAKSELRKLGYEDDD